MKTDVRKAVNAILALEDNFELNEVIEAIKQKQTYLQQQATAMPRTVC